MSPSPITRYNPQPQWSDAVVHNQTAYFVEVPESGTDVASQTHALLSQAEATLARVGSDKGRLLMATVYLKHMDDRTIVNAIWADWLPQGCAPARVCVHAEMASPDFLLEVAFIAAVGPEVTRPG